VQVLTAKQQEIVEEMTRAIAPLVATVEGAKAELLAELRKAGVAVNG
jgi:hypothetical protein